MLDIFKTKGVLLCLAIFLVDFFIGFGHITLMINSICESYIEGEIYFYLIVFFIFVFFPLALPVFFRSIPSIKSFKTLCWISLIGTLPLILAYYSGSFWFAFFATPLLCLNFIFVLPKKLTLFYKLLSKEQILRANSWIGIVVFGSLLLSALFFTFIFKAFFIPHSSLSEVLQPFGFVGILFGLLCIIKIVLAYSLPTYTLPPNTPNKTTFKEILNQQNIKYSIFGIALFASITQLYLLSIPSYLDTYFDLNGTFYTLCGVSCFCLGVILGSYITSSFAKNYPELGLSSFGFFLVALSALLLTLTHSFAGFNFLFFLLGTGNSLLLIALCSLIYFHAQEKNLQSTLMATIFFGGIGMLVCTTLSLVLLFFGLPILWFFVFGLIATLFGSYQIISHIPFLLVRALVTLAFNQRYRLIVEGFSNIPQQGGALLLGNHISLIDWAIVQMAIPRKVHFVIKHGIYSKWYIKLFLDKIKIIPIETIKAPQTLELITSLLQAGELVCLFPEETISRHGHLNEFKENYELFCNNLDRSIIIPFYIRGLWGSTFSRSSEQFQARNHSFLTKRNITIAFGEKLDIHTPKAQLKSVIFELSFKAWKSHCERMTTISRAWIATAKAHLFDIAIVDSNSGEFTYRKLLALSLMLSQLWRATTPKISIPQHSFAPASECIGILLPASFASSLCNLSILLASKVAVNLNFTSGQESLTLATKASNIHRILTSKKFLEKLKDKGISLEFPNIEMLYMEDLIEEIKKKKFKILGYLAMATLLPSFLLQEWFSPEEDTNQVATILFSSGSEGTPKGVMLNHLNIMSNIDQISNVLCIQDDDAILSSLPPFHAFGLTVTTFLPLLAGIPSITHPDPTDAVGIAKAIAKNEVTIMCGTSTFLNLYSRNLKLTSTMFESLRIVVSGAEKLKEEIRENFESKFHRSILEGYGTTETTPVVSVNLPSKFDSQSWQLHIANKDGSVGMPLPGTTIRIVNPETLEALPHNQEGLVLVGGHQVMVGYLNDIQKTSEVVVEIDGIRWYKTGDKGYLDYDGFLYITDRYSRFAKIGGEMVSLGKIEEEAEQILKENPLFSETRVLATSLEDSKKGEVIVLLVQTQSQELFSQITQMIKSSSLPPIYKPSKFIFVEQIPLLGSGKVDLKGAKNLAKELL